MADLPCLCSPQHNQHKTDPKKNKFTLDVRADDKDRNVNEPLQFYVSRSLYELVVNSVGKDSSGYLSTPKYQARNNQDTRLQPRLYKRRG
jgi:hypothetical protein